ncbi:MAG: redoxin domain-containing protein, partial [Planctomycetaceae bacterium]|nr:redoxin domain-containing protein [Planctomycetaceae bacterium]
GIGLCFEIPAGHLPGTHWFHAHRHGSTALQLSSGMAGALIVDPGSAPGSAPSLDDVVEIKEAMKDGREKILVFQQLKYSINPGTMIGEVTEKDVYQSNPPDAPRVTLINGTYAPLIEMRPGEVQRWRCIHGGIESELNLNVVNAAGQEPWDLHEIAADGIPLYEINQTKNVLLYPGYRSDFLVQAPAKVGDYVLANKTVSREQAFRKVAASDAGAFRRVPLGQVPFARVRVSGAPVTMGLPKKGVIGKYAPPEIKDSELFNRSPFKLEFAVGIPGPTINGQPFDPSREGVCPRLGTAEEWTLIAESDKHPFHIHVNPFMVVTKDASGQVMSRLWKDTILINGDGAPVDARKCVRMRFDDFAGKTVLHCHNLEHEDHGMMMAVKIVGQSKQASRCDPKQSLGLIMPGTQAPNWSLPDAQGRVHRLADLDGQRHLLVFNRGLACSHCRRQLDALASQRSALGRMRLKVVAVCPDTPDAMKQALADDEAVRSIPFLLLCDPTMDVFMRHGCFDGRALHGTFLVDANGIVQWQDVGDEPYMDIEGLLSKGRQLGSEQSP